MIHRWAFVLALLLSSLCAYAGSGMKVEKDAFFFQLPIGWDVLSPEEEDVKFWHVNFYNPNGDVIQFSVSKRLNFTKFAAAKLMLKNGMGQDKLDEGWKLKQSSTIDLPPFGQVDEEVFSSTKDNLTSATYTIYGSSNIALFTFTFDLNRDSADITTISRPLVKGFVWK